MCRCRLYESHMPIDARTRIPAGVGLLRVVHPDGQDVAFRLQIGRQVVGEAAVAIRPCAQLMTVQPYGTVHVDAVEFNAVAFPLVVGLHVERLPIPAQARREEADAAATGIVTQVFALYAPVVRHVEQAPSCIAAGWSFRIFYVAQVEAPPGIHVCHLVHLGICRDCCQQDRQAKEG